MKFSRNIALALIAALNIVVICSCSPEKRLSRLVRKHPELVKSDTIMKTDTITVPGVAKDSTFHFYQTDTITLRRDNLTVKYYLNHDSTVYIQGKCDPKTIYKAYPQYITTVTPEASFTWYERIELWLLCNLWWLVPLVLLAWKIFGEKIKTILKLIV